MKADGNLLPMPVYVGVLTGQAALIAGGSANVSVLPPASVVSWPTNARAVATIQAPVEAGVTYVCEINGITASAVTLRATNVGASASAQTWTAVVVLFDLATVQS